MPKHARGAVFVGVFDDCFAAVTVTQCEAGNMMAPPCQFQWQLAKTAETVIEQILAHVLPFGKNEDLHRSSFRKSSSSLYTTCGCRYSSANALVFLQTSLRVSGSRNNRATCAPNSLSPLQTSA